MGLFSTASPFDSDVEKATDEKNTSEDWATIMEICDKVGSSPTNCKECLKSIIKRLYHSDPHVVLQAVTLLDACVKNCGKPFHLEIASRDFEAEFRRLVTKVHPKANERLKYLLKKWAEGDFKSDPQLSLIPSLYSKLRQEGFEFTTPREIDSKGSFTSSHAKDPSQIVSQQEIDDIAKAIELSLKDVKVSNPVTKSQSLYPSASGVNSTLKSEVNSNTTKEKQLVKALYDFEAVEDNELTFYTGEIIEVLDNSDSNWWRGSNHRGEGLFPANFVTIDLSSPLQTKNEAKNTNNDEESKKNNSQVDESTSNRETDSSLQTECAINEGKIDRLLFVLHEADPTDESTDTEEMLRLETEVNAMGPVVDTELEKVDMKHAQLTQLSSNLVEALNLYHSLMREPYDMNASVPKQPFQSQQPVPPHQMLYDGHPIAASMYQYPSDQHYHSLPPGGIQIAPLAPAQHQYMTLPNHNQLMSMPPPLAENGTVNHSHPPVQSYQPGIMMPPYQQGYVPSTGMLPQQMYQQPHQGAVPPTHQ